jgi:hypothetical protein
MTNYLSPIYKVYSDLGIVDPDIVETEEEEEQNILEFEYTISILTEMYHKS